MKPKLDIGVVIPTHTRRVVNGMTHRAFHSVMKQTHPAVAIHVFHDTESRGAPFARHTALQMNRAPWTAFLDSDDHFMPQHLEVLVEAQLKTEADYVYSWYELVIMGRRQGDRYVKRPDGTLSDGVFPPGHFRDPWDPENPRQTTITMLVRTELAQSIGFWAPEDETTFEDGHRIGEDWHFTLECNRLGKIHHVPQRTWYWEHHGLNTSGRGGQGDA